ncbi:MAG: MliC family protein [Burkholderiales bacterium]|nr:MliC family protein [Burkholderiales bacterium]
MEPAIDAAIACPKSIFVTFAAGDKPRLRAGYARGTIGGLSYLVAAAIWLSVAACGHVDGRSAFIWHCAGGATFSVRFDGQGAAVVAVGDQLRVLPRAPAASGARYSDGTMQLWEHQGEATLSGTAHGTLRNCRR